MWFERMPGALRQTLAATFCLWAAMGVGVARCDEAAGIGGAGGESAFGFSLRDVDGREIVLSPAKATDFTVVVFLGVECPIAKLYAPRVQALADEFADRGVRVIGIDSNVQDSVDELREFAQTHALTFPICKDVGNVVADRYGAERITEVALLDRRLSVLYRGRIDDEFEPGLVRATSRQNDLRNALTEALAGEPVRTPKTTAVGCLIGREPVAGPTADVTYTGHVAAILRKHCVECHREGEIGPFSLTDFGEIVGWGPALVETIDDGRMPPWHAETGLVPIANERIMTDAEKDVLRRWVESGMPLGDEANLPPPIDEDASAVAASAKPDLVVPMGDRPFQVPASGTVEYQYFVVDPGFERDTWVVGAEVVPGNRSVVHHCIVFVRSPDGAATEGIGWLSAYVPGARHLPYPTGHGRRIPAGSKLVFQMHYTPTGTPQEDLTRIELRLGNDAEITHELFTVGAIRSDFEIPPNAADHSIVASRDRLPKNGHLLAVAPHMHLRGKSFTLYAETGEDRRQLLSVPRYDFNWQHVYAFDSPIPLDEIDRLVADIRFDNSSGNPSNPDPDAFVYWGDQTDEEMAIGFYEIAVPRHRPSTGDVATTPRKREENGADDAEAARFAADYLRRFDADGDGRVFREELPDAVARFGFHELDADGNGFLVADEIEAARRMRSGK